MSEPSPTRWIRAERVVLPGSPGDGAGDLRVGPAAVAIRAERIVEVREGDAAHGVADGIADVDDLGDVLLTPAFVNAHTHLALVSLRGRAGHAAAGGNLVEDLFYRVESHLTPGHVRALARMGAYESLLSGVGLVWDHYFHGHALVDALRDTGLAGVVAPTLQDLAGPGRDAWEANLAATVELSEDASLAPDGIFTALGPHATDTVSAELWERVADVAAARDLPVHLHCAQSLEEVERVHERHGRSPVAWLHRLGFLDRVPSAALVHMLFASKDDLALLDPARHVLGYCPYSQLVFGVPADPRRWERADLRWYVATDAAASNDSMNVQKELRFVAALHTVSALGSREYAAFFESGTLDDARASWALRQREHTGNRALSGGARLMSHVWGVPGALHPDARAGVIAPGALANLVAWDPRHPTLWPAADPLYGLALGDTTAAIAHMMVAGRWIGRRGDFAASLVESPEYREAARDADAALADLMEKAR